MAILRLLPGAACGLYFSHMKMDSITVSSKHHRETQWQSPHLSSRGELSSPGGSSRAQPHVQEWRPPSLSFAFCLKTECGPNPSITCQLCQGQASRPRDKDSRGSVLWPRPGQGVEEASLCPPGGAAGTAF